MVVAGKTLKTCNQVATMISIKYIVRKDRKTPQGLPIILYVNIHSKRLNFYTDVYVKNESYLVSNKVSKKDSLYNNKNNKLTKILSEANIIVLEEEDIDIIKQKINGVLNHDFHQDKKLIDYIEDFMRTKTHRRTALLYGCTINKIKAYDKNIYIEDVDKKWLMGFENFCSKTMSINGYSVYLRNIRAVFNSLLEEGKINNYPFKAYSIKREETIHRAMSVQQVIELMKINKPAYLIRYRDFFMLMIYLVGINPKDLLYLKEDNIIDGRIVYHRFKTNKLYSIKIESEAEKLLQLYKGKKYLLKFMDNIGSYLGFVKRTNNNLRKLKGFEDITTYWARHTWASIAFEAGVSKDVISLALGHSNGVKVTDIYIKYDLSKVDEANRKVIDYIKQERHPR